METVKIPRKETYNIRFNPSDIINENNGFQQEKEE